MAAIDLELHLELEEIMEALKAAGWAPVVRCRECKHGERERAANGDWMILCHQPKALDERAMMPPEWYCADGEREEEPDET